MDWGADADACFCCAKDMRFRGAGGGSSGSSPKRSVSSDMVGMGVVRALAYHQRMSFLPKTATHLTTTTEKSGRGGAVFLNGVDGLYRL